MGGGGGGAYNRSQALTHYPKGTPPTPPTAPTALPTANNCPPNRFRGPLGPLRGCAGMAPSDASKSHIAPKHTPFDHLGRLYRGMAVNRCSQEEGESDTSPPPPTCAAPPPPPGQSMRPTAMPIASPLGGGGARPCAASAAVPGHAPPFVRGPQGGGGCRMKWGGGVTGLEVWAMRQRILGSHTPPCHRRMGVWGGGYIPVPPLQKTTPPPTRLYPPPLVPLRPGPEEGHRLHRVEGGGGARGIQEPPQGQEAKAGRGPAQGPRP